MLFCCKTTHRKSGTKFSTLEPCLQTHWIINPRTSSSPHFIYVIWKLEEGFPRHACHSEFMGTDNAKDSRSLHTECFAPPNKDSRSGRRNVVMCWECKQQKGITSIDLNLSISLSSSTLFVDSCYECIRVCCKWLFWAALELCGYAKEIMNW